MHVDPAEALPEKALRVDKPKHLCMIGNSDLRQGIEQRQDFGASREKPASQFTHDKGVRKDFTVEQQLAKSRIAATEMVYPDGGVGQRQAAPERRRGIGRNFFCEPPSCARRRALSRAIKASRPRWMSAVFSCTPVRLAALLSRSSFRFNVVRMQTYMHTRCRCVKEPNGVQLTIRLICGRAHSEAVARPVACRAIR